MDSGDTDLRRMELEIRRRQVELPSELATLGLRGTLIGLIAGVVLITVLALVGAIYNKVRSQFRRSGGMIGVVYGPARSRPAAGVARPDRAAGRLRPGAGRGGPAGAASRDR